MYFKRNVFKEITKLKIMKIGWKSNHDERQMYQVNFMNLKIKYFSIFHILGAARVIE